MLLCSNGSLIVVPYAHLHIGQHAAQLPGPPRYPPLAADHQAISKVSRARYYNPRANARIGVAEVRGQAVRLPIMPDRVRDAARPHRRMYCLECSGSS